MSLLDKKDPEGQHKYRVLHGFCLLLDLVAIGWFIAGNYWVFSFSPGPNYEFCDRLLYDYSFWVIIVSYIAFGCVVLFACGCMSLAYAMSRCESS